MPYISKSLREPLDKVLNTLPLPLTTGEAAYLVTRVILRTGASLRERDFHDYATVLGVLEAVKLELYRRVVAGYEEGKRVMNGDLEEFA